MSSPQWCPLPQLRWWITAFVASKNENSYNYILPDPIHCASKSAYKLCQKTDARGQINSPGLLLYTRLWHKPHVRDQMGRAVPCEGTSAVLVQWLSWQQWPAALLCCDAWISALLAAVWASAAGAADLKNTSQHSQPLLSTSSELACEGTAINWFYLDLVWSHQNHEDNLERSMYQQA